MGARHSNQSHSSHDIQNTDTCQVVKYCQGTSEAQVSYGGEADLHRHLEGCDKNTGHVSFIPVDHFHAEHLPSGCQDNDLVDLVRALSDLTVRVTVKYVSERRPEIVPGSGKTYPCCSQRGLDMMRVGTGWISEVRRFPDQCTACSCEECLNSQAPQPLSAHIYIQTAAHVVYDKLEGASTVCHLFYDRAGTPDACRGVVTLSGMSDVWSGAETDWCWMRCGIHDLDLTDKLHEMVTTWNCLYEKVYYSYREDTTSNRI